MMRSNSPISNRTVSPSPEIAVQDGWTRPVPVKKDSNLRAWLFFLALVCVVVAAWVPVRSVYQRMRYQPLLSGPRDADTFLALSYAGVSGGITHGPDEVSRKQFEQHIRALRTRGFNPIGLEDVRAFYREGRLLPRQAVLITMEQSRRNSYLETRAILRQYRWRAVMFVRADTVIRRDSDALRWPILRDMARSGTWDLGAQSVDGFRPVPVGPDGQTGNFFASPEWIVAENRLERVAEFKARIAAEHAKMVNTFRNGIGQSPVAFAFPYGDYGQFDARAESTRVLNLDAIGKHYDLGFALGPFPLNTRYTDPRALNRLRVDPAWSLDTFVALLESAAPVRPWEMEAILSESRWRTVWGLAEISNRGALRIRAVRSDDLAVGPPSTGALTWLVGSDLFDDLTMRMRFRLTAGQGALRLRSSTSGEESIRFLLDEDGNSRVERKLRGVVAFPVASTMLSLAPTETHSLDVLLRGSLMIVWLDGNMVFMEPLSIMGDVQPGLLGIEVWDPLPGRAALEIESIEFPRPRRSLVFWGPEEPVAPDGILAQLHQAVWRQAAVSPPWLDIQRSVPIVLPRIGEDALRGFGQIYQVPVLPRMVLHDVALASAIPSELPVQEVRAGGFDGLFVDCRQMPADDIPRLIPWLRAIRAHIKENNMQMAVSLPAAVKRVAGFASIAALLPGVVMAVEDARLAEDMRRAGVQAVESESLTLPPGDLHLDLYYQLAARELPIETMSPWARQARFRRQGLDAYYQGDYARSIQYWEQWLEHDPFSSEVLGLIGGAYVRMGEPVKGLEYYTRSLELNPGQVGMVVRKVELLDTMERFDESREHLNLYARIFPENREILIAQARWLYRRRRREEARSLLTKLVERDPAHVGARVALLDMVDDPQVRYRILRDILAIGHATDAQIPFGNMLLAHELLTYPESGVFLEYIRAMAISQTAATQRRSELYRRFLPLENRVVDHFAAGQLSDEWIASEGVRTIESGRFELRAAVDRVETYLRLRRSELMRDGYIEVVIDETQGFFWTYARRSARAMLRFGFDEDGFIHLQAWHQGELLASHSRPWLRPPGTLTLRLELCGDGARGYVNQLEIFDEPLDIPSAVAYGWWGIAPFAFELGTARARIVRMECAPVPAAIALIGPGSPEKQIERLRPHVGELSVMAPVWGVQKPDGTLPDALPPGTRALRMFAAFQRIRLLPVLDLAYDGMIDPVLIVDYIHANRLTGVLVRRRSNPSRNWLEALRKALEERPASVIVMRCEAALWEIASDTDGPTDSRVARPGSGDRLLPRSDESVTLIEIPVGGVMLSPLHAIWEASVSLPGLPVEDGMSRVAPRLHVMGRDGWLAMPDGEGERMIEQSSSPDR